MPASSVSAACAGGRLISGARLPDAGSGPGASNPEGARAHHSHYRRATIPNRIFHSHEAVTGLIERAYGECLKNVSLLKDTCRTVITCRKARREGTG